MPNQDFHLTDQELLLAADGELPTRRAVQVRAHLAGCRACIARMAETEGAVTDFARIYRDSLEPQMPPIAESRARLRAHLAELTPKREFSSWRRFFGFPSATGAVAFIFVAALVIVAAGKPQFPHFTPRGASSAVDSLERGVVPDRGLTPGAARRVKISEVCSTAHEDVVSKVSTSLREEVFQEYGIANARANDYEIDYLIAPGLGGEEDIHNLWPESYTSSAWNAHVKDDLEEQLHHMVCAGNLDPSTAQRDIASDWIAAYKKYFHTDRPLSRISGLIQSEGKSNAPSTISTGYRFPGERPALSRKSRLAFVPMTAFSEIFPYLYLNRIGLK